MGPMMTVLPGGTQTRQRKGATHLSTRTSPRSRQPHTKSKLCVGPARSRSFKGTECLAPHVIGRECAGRGRFRFSMVTRRSPRVVVCGRRESGPLPRRLGPTPPRILSPTADPPTDQPAIRRPTSQRSAPLRPCAPSDGRPVVRGSTGASVDASSKREENQAERRVPSYCRTVAPSHRRTVAPRGATVRRCATQAADGLRRE